MLFGMLGRDEDGHETRVEDEKVHEVETGSCQRSVEEEEDKSIDKSSPQYAGGASSNCIWLVVGTVGGLLVLGGVIAIIAYFATHHKKHHHRHDPCATRPIGLGAMFGLRGAGGSDPACTGPVKPPAKPNVQVQPPDNPETDDPNVNDSKPDDPKPDEDDPVPDAPPAIDCGADASLVKAKAEGETDSCQCNDAYREWNNDDEKCDMRCSDEQEMWDGANENCAKRCPNDQKWHVKKGNCVNRCSEDKKWVDDQKQCSEKCSDDQKWDAEKGECKCSTNTFFEDKSKKCLKCTDTNGDYDQTDGTCPCLYDHKRLDSGKCPCTGGKYKGFPVLYHHDDDSGSKTKSWCFQDPDEEEDFDSLDIKCKKKNGFYVVQGIDSNGDKTKTLTLCGKFHKGSGSVEFKDPDACKNPKNYFVDAPKWHNDTHRCEAVVTGVTATCKGKGKASSDPVKPQRCGNVKFPPGDRNAMHCKICADKETAVCVEEKSDVSDYEDASGAGKGPSNP